jgi:hypothetical protein
MFIVQALNDRMHVDCMEMHILLHLDALCMEMHISPFFARTIQAASKCPFYQVELMELAGKTQRNHWEGE